MKTKLIAVYTQLLRDMDKFIKVMAGHCGTRGHCS